MTSRTLSDQSSRHASRRVLEITVGASMLVALGVSSRALAFNNTSDYGKTPIGNNITLLGGGAGRYYTGSPADGYSCENCHSAPAAYSFPIQLTGLPQDGYVPGQQYKIEISSPIANMQLAQALANGKSPAASLTAEFVAEDGGPAGTIDFVSDSDRKPDRFPDQYCTTLAMVPPTDLNKQNDEYGTIVYQADTGTQAREITLSKRKNEPEKYPPCSVEHGRNADGAEYDRRCIVTMKNCGTRTVRFLWTAPEKWSSPIWFSMGYVATYNLSGEPNDEDYVTTMTIPLNPSYKGPTFETELSSGCSVVMGPQGGAGGRGFGLGGLSVLGLWLGGMVIARSRKRRASASLPLAAASLFIVLAVAGVGCGDAGKGLVTEVPGSVGVYDSIGCVRDCIPPLDCRKGAWPDAGTPETVAEADKAAKMMMTDSTATAGALNPTAGAAAGTGDPGVAPPTGLAKSLGKVTAVLSSAQPAGVVSTYSVKCGGCDPNYFAAWIVNDKDEYVRMLHTQGGTYVAATMPLFTKLGSDCQRPREEIDATATATKTAHEQYTLEWDGLYGNGHIAAPPGIYRIKVEVAIDEMHPIPPGDISFTFGDPAPYTVVAEPAPSHTAVTLTYTPNP